MCSSGANYATHRGTSAERMVVANASHRTVRTPLPERMEHEPLSALTGRYERQKPKPSRANAPSRKYGRYGASPAAATAPLAPSSATTAGPAQQRLAIVPTPATPTAPSAEPVAMYLSFSFMTPWAISFPRNRGRLAAARLLAAPISTFRGTP